VKFPVTNQVIEMLTIEEYGKIIQIVARELKKQK
jgi:hypothetical protein